jgi:hypothetical protein
VKAVIQMKKNDSSNQTQTIYTLGQTVVAAMGNKMASISAATALLLLAGSASAQTGRMGMRSASAGARPSISATRQPSRGSMSTRPTSSGSGMGTRQPSSSVRQPFTNGGRPPRNPMSNSGRVTGFRNHDIPVHGFRGHDVFGWSGGGSYLVPEPVYTDVAVGYPVATEVAPAYPEPAYAAAPCGCQAAAPVAAAYPVYPAPVAVPAMVSVPVGPMVMGFGGYYGGHVGGPWRHHPVRRFGRR